MLNNIGLPGLLFLLVFFVAIFSAYRVSVRMGFGTGGSILIAASSIFELPILIWWMSDGPLEKKNKISDEVFK